MRPTGLDMVDGPGQVDARPDDVLHAGAGFGERRQNELEAELRLGVGAFGRVAALTWESEPYPRRRRAGLLAAPWSSRRSARAASGPRCGVAQALSCPATGVERCVRRWIV